MAEKQTRPRRVVDAESIEAENWRVSASYCLATIEVSEPIGGHWADYRQFAEAILVLCNEMDEREKQRNRRPVI